MKRLDPRGLALHAALLLVPPLVVGSGSGAGLLAGLVWVAATAAEDHSDEAPPERVPGCEVLRGLGMLLALWVTVATAGPVQPVLIGLGLAAVIGGSTLRRSAVRALGPAFRAAVAPTGPRVMHGPYRWLAHPSELGLLAMVAGVVCMAGSPWGALASAGLVGMPGAVRMLLESRAMRAADQPVASRISSR